LLFRRTFDRLWILSLVLAVIFGGTWLWGQIFALPLVLIEDDFWLLLTAAIAGIVAAYAFLARFLAYVQACDTHLAIVTPFLRVNISYRRFQAVRTALMHQLFPKNESSWAQRSFLGPFYGKTAIVIDLNSWPLQPTLLRLFWPKPMFSTRSRGLVILVKDWMQFSTELDSYQGLWLQAQGKQARVRFPER
jgi:hypothetical protein